MRPEFISFRDPVPYSQGLEAMAARHNAIVCGQATESIWLLTHPPIYTAGRRTTDQELDHLAAAGLPWVPCPRGGRLTYHGPGQRMLYPLINLRARGLSVTTYIHLLQQWVITSLADLGVPSFCVKAHPGVWTAKGKIASVGVYVSGGVTSHGVAIHVLEASREGFAFIDPCGLSVPVTTITAFHRGTTLCQVDELLKAHCPF